MKEGYRGFGIYIVIVLILSAVLIFSSLASGAFSSREQVSDGQFRELMEKENVVGIQVLPIKVGTAEMANAYISYKDKDGNAKNVVYYVSNIENFREFMKENYPDIALYVEAVKEDSIWSQFLPLLVSMVAVVILMVIFFGRMQNGGANGHMANFGRSRAQMMNQNENRIRFNNVAGLTEEKEEMQEIVEFLKSPQRFIQLGARIPKGVLLVGPPGTGKTYLAKAVAGEAGVPFFTISGSDFVEMFVGVGASRVRDLFEQAKKNAPCIIFIDEIDAVGRHRGAGLGGGHDEREQTLNQLLVEMDGFTINHGVIVLAATNRVDILDPALLRPGRFDRRIVVDRPDVREREEVLKVHSKNKPLGEDINLTAIAKTTSGFTPADLENLMNEAAIYAAREGKKFISMADVQRAFVKVGVGTEKKSRVISDKAKNITAYHEAGHAILHQVLPLLDPVHSISIIPTGMAGGYTMFLEDDEDMYLSKKQMEQRIVSLLGGRIAEEIKIGDITTGASNDIERATAIARAMVTKYGMSDRLGPIQFGEENDEVFLGRDIGHQRNYGEEIAGTIDSEIRTIIEKACQEARQILTEYDTVLERTRDVLLEKEKITGEEFAALFSENRTGEEKAADSER